ncbi:hypothetical protein EW093_13130 [Thiospirochaeta perfilievii]|uniref:Uncharacterized protein n=1 Tax=Thiospirochaeta perfilievii TaxID=252967 RepID=A0A5C1QC04_9SPIO|nr:oligosaccharide flippase family protein [Thiospirochaeta perfilievii]QEN05613.1 hypothetical protein EW093_13130 [Thiospirochaeta perfilievii]
MINRNKNFLESLLTFSLGPFISALLGFLFIPLTTKLISPVEYGKGSFFITIVNLISLVIILGLDQSYVRFFNESNDKKKLLYNSVFIPILLSVLIGFCLILFWKPLSIFLFSESDFYIMFLLSVSLLFSILLRFSSLVIRMKEKGSLFSIFTIVNKIVLILVLFLWAKYVSDRMIAVVMSYVISLFVIFFLQILVEKKEWNFDHFTPSLDEQKAILKFGLPLIVSGGLMWVLNSMDKIALRAWSDFEELGLYSNAFRIAGLLTVIQTSFTTFWIPTSYRWYTEKVDYNKFNKVSEILTLVLTLVFILIVWLKGFFRFFIDESYYDSIAMVSFLLFMPLMYTLSETTGLGISFSKKSWLSILVALIASSTNIVGNYILVPRLGGIGASISTGLSFIVFFWARTIISNRLMKLVKIKLQIIATCIMLLFACFSYGNSEFIELSKIALPLIVIVSIILIYKIKYKGLQTNV